MVILLIILLLIPFLWLTGFLFITDFSVLVKDTRGIHHVLAIFPQRLLARVKPSEYLVIDANFREKQASPTHKLFIKASVFPKIKAWYAYKSQYVALKEETTQLLSF